MLSPNNVRSLEAFRVFDAVAETGGFSRAAAELGITHGAVSRRIALLEHDLGVRLFERSSRGASLTGDGRVLYEAVRAALNDLSRAVESLRLGKGLRPFLLSCERSVAVKWLVPRLSAFQDANPGFVVYLSTGGGSVEFSAAPLDAAIRRADFVMDSSWSVEPFMKEFTGPVMRPDLVGYFKAGKLVRLHTTTRPSAWKTWAARIGTVLGQATDQYFDHFFLCLEAAVSGLGAAVVPYSIAADALAEGRLAAPQGFVPDGTEYCLISEKPIRDDPRKQLFLEWLRSQALELETGRPR